MDAIDFIILGFFLVLFFLFIIVISIYKKKWKLLIFLCIIPIFAYYSFNFYYENQYWTNIFGANPFFYRLNYEFNSSRYFNGDGFSFEVYNLPEHLKNHFLQISYHDLSKFPKKPNYREHWSVFPWTMTPYEEKNEKYINFALMMDPGDRSEIFEKNIQKVKEALNTKGNYYSLFYYDHSEIPGNVDLFVVDLKNNLFFYINLNT